MRETTKAYYTCKVRPKDLGSEEDGRNDPTLRRCLRRPAAVAQSPEAPERATADKTRNARAEHRTGAEPEASTGAERSAAPAAIADAKLETAVPSEPEGSYALPREKTRKPRANRGVFPGRRQCVVMPRPRGILPRVRRFAAWSAYICSGS